MSNTVNNQMTNQTTTPTIVYTLNNEDCTASLSFTVTRRYAATTTDEEQKSDYLSVAVGENYVERTEISFAALERFMKKRTVKRFNLILTPCSVTPNAMGKCPVCFYHFAEHGEIQTYNCEVGKELVIDLRDRGEFLDQASYFMLDVATESTHPYSVQFYASGEHAPRIELEYYLDEDHERSFHSLPTPNGTAAELDVHTGEMEFSFVDGAVAVSPLGITLSHVCSDGKDTNRYGCGFGLSLDERLKKRGDSTVDADYIYTDPTGTEHGFYEYFYYMNEGARVNVSKADVETDSEGNLSYNCNKVTRLLRSSTGWEASAKLEGVKKIPLFEQRTEEEAQIEEQIESYKKALCDYVKLNKTTGVISKVVTTDPSWSHYESCEPQSSELLMPLSDAMNYRSLCLQSDALATQMDSCDLQEISLGYQKDSMELQKRNCELQMASLNAQYELNVSDKTFADNQVVYQTRMMSNYGLGCGNYGKVGHMSNVVVPTDVANDTGWLNHINYCFAQKQIDNSTARSDGLEKLNQISGDVAHAYGCENDSLYLVSFDQKTLTENQIPLIENSDSTKTDLKKINADQRDNAEAQLALCERQLTEIESKAEEHLEAFKTYLVAFLQLEEKLSALRKQIPVSYMKKDGIIKGFNNEGYLVAVFDRYENVVAIERDKNERIARVYDGKGNEATFSYVNDRLTELCDVYGNLVSYSYSADSYLSAVTYADGATLSLTYDENGNVKTVTAAGGNSDESKVSFAYNGDGKVKAVTHASTKSRISYSDTQAGETVISSLAITYGLTETTVTDAENETAFVYRFDDRENLSEYYLVEKDLVAEAKKTVRDYESENRNKTVYTAFGAALCKKPLESFSFDGFAGIRKEETLYNAFRLPTEKTVFTVFGKTFTDVFLYNEAAECFTSYTYDAKQRLIKESTEESHAAYMAGTPDYQSYEPFRTSVTEYTYDAIDRIVRRESYLLGKELSEGKTVEETVYGENGRVKESYTYNSLDPASKLYTVTEQDESGRTVAEYDATGRYKTALSYAPDGSLKSEHLPNGACIAYGASPDGRSTSVTASTEEGEENTNVTHYTAGVVTKLESGGNTVEYTYDGKRRVTSVSLNGQLYASYTHDVMIGELYKSSSVTYANGESFEKREYLIGNGTDVVYKNAFIYSESRAADGRLLNRDSEGYTYDADGKLLSVAANNQFVKVTSENYTYDHEGRVAGYSVTPAGKTDATVYNYTFDSVTGRLLSTSVDGILISPNLDKLGRNAGKTVTVGGTQLAKERISYLKFGDRATSLPSTLTFEGANKTDTLSYIYDKTGNICEIRENARIKARYAYDALGRLIREDNRDFAKTECFVYDNRGNILSKREYPFSLENMDKVEALSPTDEKYYSYNGDRLMSYNGETFAYDVLGNPTVYRGKSAVWEYARRLKSFDGISFTYDGLGRCTQMGENTIAYDHSGNIVEANGLRVLYDHTGVFAIKYNDSTYFYRKNAQNDIVALLDNTGAVVVEYKYNAWGKCKVLNPDGTENTSATFIGNINPFRYRSYYFDTNTGLYYLKSRFYDPETCRFLNADTIDYLEPDTVNGLNLYAYCRNNPVMYSDPSGHSPNWWQWVLAGIAIAGAITISILTMGTATPVLVGMLIGGVASAGFEIGSQIISDGGIHDVGAILSATLGGMVAGAISGIPVFSGFTLGNYIGTAALGGVASLVGGIVSGGVSDFSSGIIAFSLGALGNIAAKAVNQLVVNKITGKIMDISSNKSRSLAINNYFITHNVTPMGFGHSTFGGWSRNLFKNMPREFFKTVVIDTTGRSAIVYSAFVSSAISGWY